jgi:hypothetical protein
MEGTGSGSCKLSGFGISGIKSSRSVSTESISHFNLRVQLSIWLVKLFQI